MKSGVALSAVTRRLAVLAAGMGIFWVAVLGGVSVCTAIGWTNEGGPYGGRIEAAEYAGSGRLIAGTRNGGVFVTADAAASWHTANTGLTDLIVTCAVVNRLNAKTAYIGTSGGGVFRTASLWGETAWVNTSYNIGNRDIECIAMCRSDTTMIFAGTSAGLFKGLAGGGVWMDISGNLTDKNIAAIAFPGSGADTIFVGTSGSTGGVFKTTNGGASWTLKNSGLTFPYIAILRADPSNPSVLIAGTTGGGVFKTTNGGDAWTAKNTGLSNLAVRDLRINPANPLKYYAGTAGGFFYTTNGGTSWTALNTGLTDHDVQAVALDTEENVLYAGGYWGGVHKSVGLAPWQPAVEGMTNTFISDIDCLPEAGFVVQVSSYGRVFVSEDGGENWLDRSSGIACEALTGIAIDQAAPDTVYIGADYGGVYKSVNGGVTWTAMNSGLAALDVKCLRLANTGGNAVIYAGTYNYLYRSTNGARNWVKKSSGITDKHIWTIEVDPSNPATVYVGTYGGGVFKTTNSGESWAAVNGGLGSVYIAAVAVDPAHPDVVYAGAYYGGGIYKSEDGGSTWHPSSSGAAGADVWTIDVNPFNSREVLAGTFSGVFLSVDHGATWEPYTEGMDVRDTRRVVFHRQLGARRVYAGTYGGGVYRYDDILTAVTEIAPPAGPRIRLDQNYPNPFNPVTTIAYEIAGGGCGAGEIAVRLDVYDVIGRHVRSLVRTNQPPGSYRVTWRGDTEHGVRAASGVYFARLRAGPSVGTVKMVLIE
jgi:photosystem II stability/assembly factor-like uncharacterized protein